VEGKREGKRIREDKEVLAEREGENATQRSRGQRPRVPPVSPKSVLFSAPVLGDTICGIIRALSPVPSSLFICLSFSQSSNLLIDIFRAFSSSFDPRTETRSRYQTLVIRHARFRFRPFNNGVIGTPEIFSRRIKSARACDNECGISCFERAMRERRKRAKKDTSSRSSRASSRRPRVPRPRGNEANRAARPPGVKPPGKMAGVGRSREVRRLSHRWIGGDEERDASQQISTAGGMETNN